MTTENLSGAGSWVVPAGVFSVEVEAIGGGGGARGGTGLGAGGGGGGGGAYASSVVAVTPGQSIPYVVGAGGLGTNFNTGTGITGGGDTSWNNGQVLAKGASAAAANSTGGGGAGGQAANCVGTVIVGGGDGSRNSGGAGGDGGTAASGGTLVGGTGGIAGSGTSPTNAGSPGDPPGGGGGGGRNITGGNGGSGANGALRLTYEVSVPKHGSGSSTGSGALSGTGRKIVRGAGTLSGSAVQAGVGRRVPEGIGSIVASGTLTGSGTNPGINSGSMIGSGILWGVGLRRPEGEGSLTGSGSISGAGHRVARAYGGLVGAGTLTGASLVVRKGNGFSFGSGFLTGFGNNGPHEGPQPMIDYLPGNRSWTADFTGAAVIIQWGGGGGGAAGEGLTRGGKGGGAGALAVDLVQVVTGQTYPYYNGPGGVGGDYNGSKVGTDGQASYFGGGTRLRAAGGHGAGPNNTGGQGGQVSDSLGRARVSGQEGQTRPGTFDGGPGGKAPDQGIYHGGAGGATPGQVGSNPGQSPGGGGSGGGHASGANGGAGASGGTVIFKADDSTLPGYYLVGVNEDYNFSLPGTYDDFVPTGDGVCWFEAVGSGGGGRGGNGLAFRGGHGGSGGAWAAAERTVYRGVSYRRVVPAGGAGTVLNGAAAGNGADASWTLTPLRIMHKQVSGNVATIWTCAAGSTTPQKHGLEIGEQVVIAGVDSVFNGTYTVTAVSADRLSFSYAKVNANITKTAVTPTGTSASLATPFVLAKGGLGATGHYTDTSSTQPGGKASECIGDLAANGDRGQATQSPTTTWGGNGGGGSLPLGELGGWAGGSNLASTGPAGEPGNVPGGGGGGGRGVNGGNGGNGAAGGAVVRWITELHGIWNGGQRRSVTRVTVWTGGSPRTVTDVNVFAGGAKRNTVRTLPHPESLKRRYPTYLPDNMLPFFDRDTGTFNWRDGVGDKILNAMAANDLDVMVFGDSVAEGWVSLDPLTFVGTKDFPKAWPRFARDQLIAAVPGLTLGGTGAIRANTVSGVDPQWSISGWSASGDKHYVTSSNPDHVAMFTPGVDSAGVQIMGNKVGITYSGGGIHLRIGGAVVAIGPPTAGPDVLGRLEYTLPSVSAPSLSIRPASTTNVLLFSASVYTDNGIRVHNLAQGGAKAGGGTGQSYYGPASGMTSPANMTAVYTQPKFVRAAKVQPDVYVVFLGGNDSAAGTSAAEIKAAFKRITDMIRAKAPNATIVLMPDAWTADRTLALAELCREDNLGMIDVYYLSRALTTIYGQNYNGDPFGHLNVAGAAWVGAMMRDAFLYDPNG